MAEQKTTTVLKENPMRQIRIEKLTINIGVGKQQDKLDKAIKLLAMLTSEKPVKTVTNKRLAAWGLRPGLPIGCKVTLRGKKAVDMLRRLLEAKERKLTQRQFDENGNVSFGLHEYIDIPQAKYDPSIGNLGLEACVTLGRPGSRIARRAFLRTKVPMNARVGKQEALAFMQKTFNVTLVEKSAGERQ